MDDIKPLERPPLPLGLQELYDADVAYYRGMIWGKNKPPIRNPTTMTFRRYDPFGIYSDPVNLDKQNGDSMDLDDEMNELLNVYVKSREQASRDESYELGVMNHYMARYTELRLARESLDEKIANLKSKMKDLDEDEDCGCGCEDGDDE